MIKTIILTIDDLKKKAFWLMNAGKAITGLKRQPRAVYYFAVGLYNIRQTVPFWLWIISYILLLSNFKSMIYVLLATYIKKFCCRDLFYGLKNHFTSY
jgi:hypothetical protein